MHANEKRVNTNREGLRNSEKEDRASYRPPSKPPYLLNVNGEVIGIIENMVPKIRPPPKPPRIHSNVDRELKDLGKEYLLDTVLNYRPPPKPPPEVYDRVRMSWIK